MACDIGWQGVGNMTRQWSFALKYLGSLQEPTRTLRLTERKCKYRHAKVAESSLIMSSYIRSSLIMSLSELCVWATANSLIMRVNKKLYILGCWRGEILRIMMPAVPMRKKRQRTRFRKNIMPVALWTKGRVEHSFITYRHHRKTESEPTVKTVGSSMELRMESNWPGRQYLGCLCKVLRDRVR